MHTLRFVLVRLMTSVLPLCLVAYAGPLFAQEDTEQPFKFILRSSEYLAIEAACPTLGIERVDEESAAFVELLMESFEREVAELVAETQKDRPDALADISSRPHELSVEYAVTRPSDKVVSILWNIWTYTGGAHPLLTMVTNNYDTDSGYPLLLEDLFVDPALAILQFTRVSRRQLAPRPDDPEREFFSGDMLQSGTEPLEENFRVFAVIPQGIRLHFPPYQVAPWAVGAQTVDVTLEELEAAKPRLEYWAQQAS